MDADNQSRGRGRILVVDDDDNLRRVLTLRLESAGYEVTAATSGEEACERLPDAEPHMVITDLRMPGIGGIELLEAIQARSPGVPVAILTAHGEIPDAVRATQAGAVDFLTKPVGAELLTCVEAHVRPSHESSVIGTDMDGIVTHSPVVRALLHDARRVARHDSAVLICGPSGSGKELLAGAIHRASTRASRPMVAINCAAVPPELLESELFGHRRGAFTGANYDHPGLFRSAEGGTVFLDEIGDMPERLQSKLLRVLQEREVRPVGELRSIPIDVRVVSATHRDLPGMIADGTFREDLYYRLNVVRLNLPSLAERREDIPLLVAHRLTQLVECGAPRRVFAPEAMELLLTAAWPGNIRQLFNVVEQTVALSPSSVISSALVRRALGEQESAMPSLDHAREEFVQNYLRQTLKLAGGNVSRAARIAGRNRTDFYKLLRRYRIGGPDPVRNAGEPDRNP
jgi:two-component system, NtrC family, response regulator GlrR